MLDYVRSAYPDLPAAVTRYPYRRPSTTVVSRRS